jgi:hypothetical protein
MVTIVLDSIETYYESVAVVARCGRRLPILGCLLRSEFE